MRVYYLTFFPEPAHFRPSTEEMARVKLGGSDKVPRSVAGSSGSKSASACPSSCLHQGGQGWRTTTRPRQLDNAASDPRNRS